MLSVSAESITGSEAQDLIAALKAELIKLYGEHEDVADHDGLDPRDVEDGRGVFVVARLDGAPVGCGAVRRREPDTGEVKRMYVKPGHRGQGIGRHILSALESAARQLGFTRLVLETGELQPAAISLYQSCGFARIPCFGEYAAYEGDGSVCMEKVLGQPRLG